jgi:hypothetical protein
MSDVWVGVIVGLVVIVIKLVLSSIKGPSYNSNDPNLSFNHNQSPTNLAHHPIHLISQFRRNTQYLTPALSSWPRCRRLPVRCDPSAGPIDSRFRRVSQ